MPMLRVAVYAASPNLANNKIENKLRNTEKLRYLVHIYHLTICQTKLDLLLTLAYYILQYMVSKDPTSVTSTF